ncbi:MAG TPA: hypothetical protein VFW19_11500 [Allosphingosinicella sp.]|nr:hypothetical protein [Allosphingosinicella sp.]
MRRAFRIDTARPLLAGLFLFALMLRLLVPAGYMIGTDASGAPALILCSGVEAPPTVHHAMRMPGGSPMHHHDPADHRDAPCPFAALAAPALPPSPPVMTAALAPPAEPAAPPFAVGASSPALAAPPPPATGPPAFA